ncbi:porphobilinogen deaminase [Hyaloraphidium curvatum]|nr:porphobilinogen deaminase [Hyaloraphidium curvatum]
MADATPARKKFVIGSRKSQLALVQTHEVKGRLERLYPDFEFAVETMTTTGDNVLDRALSMIGTKSLFTKELEVALVERTVDLVVHSLKDIPTTLPPGMCLGAILEREDPRDAVVMSRRNAGKRLGDLPEGSVVGTSSVRRSAQLKAKFPHLTFKDVRGNLNTRLQKLDAEDGPYDALLLAWAGLHRLGWDERISEVLGPETMLHAVGQGALAVECRLDDEQVRELLQPLDHRATRLKCTAERSFMRELEGGCSVPLGVWTVIATADGGDAGSANGAVQPGDRLSLQGTVCSLDGTKQVSDQIEGVVPAGAPGGGHASEEEVQAASAIGKQLAMSVVAKGGADILRQARSQMPAAPLPAPAQAQHQAEASA